MKPKRSCTCGTPLPRLELVSDEGVNHVTGEVYFRCRKCLLLAGAQANLVLAYRRLALVRLQAKDRLTPLVKT